MVMDWFRSSKASSVNELILKKDYEPAIALLEEALEKNGKNERLRLQLAHVLVLSARKGEAIAVLDQLSDDLASDGFATKAVAILKKIQRLDPDRTGIDERLATQIKGKAQISPRPWMDTRYVGEPTALEVSESGELLPPQAKPADAARGRADQPKGSGALETPLFRGMSRDEILAVIRGLRFRSLGPGHILVTEGEPGDSLYVLTTGLCRAHVRNPSGRNMEVRELEEGDFFGEIAILTGEARTATVTTVTSCELLELDRTALNSIIESHPNVLEVLREFHKRRAESTIEAAIRGMQKV